MKKIVLCCNGAMSTSLLVQKMQKVISEKSIQILVEATSLSSAIEHIDSADCILLAPQISYAVHDFEKAAGNHRTPIALISMQDFGLMRAEKIVDDALELIQDR